MMSPLDWELFRLAKRQHGVVSSAQLHALRLKRKRRGRMLYDEELVPILPRVFGLYWSDDTSMRRTWAAALWSRSVVSHWTAAALHGLLTEHASEIHVTLERDRGVSHASPAGWLTVHRTKHFGCDDCVVDGLPVTTVARTLFDLMDVMPARDHFELAMRVVRERRVSMREFKAALSQLSAGRYHAKQVRALLEGAQQQR